MNDSTGQASDAGNLQFSTFHYYSRLPAELRREVWLHHLSEATVPHVYRFIPTYPRYGDQRSYPPGHCPHPDDAVLLVPCVIGNHRPPRLEQRHLQPLADSTAAARRAGASCSEARRIVLGLLPHELPFRFLPRRWGSSSWKMSDAKSRSGAGYPEHVLRFHGARDIIVLHAVWEEQKSITALVALQGRPPEVFRHIENLGLTLGSFGRQGLMSRSYRSDPHECRCSTDECQDCCRAEPLPRFLLTCFPALRAFFITRISSVDLDVVSSGETLGAVLADLEDASCRCEHGSPRHVWQTVEAADLFTDDGRPGQCVIYDERSGCFPSLWRIEYIRSSWNPRFPYYKMLGHLDIRILQKLK